MSPIPLSESQPHLLITAVGTDRPGIVDDLAGWLFGLGLNIEESRMAQLGGEFAILMLVSGSKEKERGAEASREAFGRESGLTIFVRPARPEPASPEKPVLPYSLAATALDHPGIVHRVTRLLRGYSINIVDATTRTTPAPFTGTPIFRLDIEMDIPADVSMAKLRDDLRALGDQANIDFDLTMRER
jgi:glycine cleavage system transcriptional repressor